MGYQRIAPHTLPDTFTCQLTDQGITDSVTVTVNVKR